MSSVLPFFKYLLSSNLINFLLMVGILVWVFKKFNLMNCLNEGINKIISSIKTSEDDKSRAQDNYTNIRKEYAALPDKLKEIENSATDNANLIIKNIEKNTNSKVKSIKDSIQKTIENEESAITSDITNKTFKASIERARANLEKKLSEEPELHKKFIEKSLDEFERIEL